jgi:hypothetical protein
VTREPTLLQRSEDGASVDAELDTGLRPTDLALIERVWGPARLAIFNALRATPAERREYPQSLHWDWSRKVGDLKLLEARGFGVFCEGQWQGAMLTKTATHVAQLAAAKGKPLVYIDYVESAPWNWSVPAIGQNGRFRGVGSVLMRQAVLQSFDEDFKGRVGLHALPSAERFYAGACRMTAIGHDPTKQNLMYFELPAEEAERFVDDEGGAT